MQIGLEVILDENASIVPPWYLLWCGFVHTSWLFHLIAFHFISLFILDFYRRRLKLNINISNINNINSSSSSTQLLSPRLPQRPGPTALGGKPAEWRRICRRRRRRDRLRARRRLEEDVRSDRPIRRLYPPPPLRREFRPIIRLVVSSYIHTYFVGVQFKQLLKAPSLVVLMQWRWI